MIKQNLKEKNKQQKPPHKQHVSVKSNVSLQKQLENEKSEQIKDNLSF